MRTGFRFILLVSTLPALILAQVRTENGSDPTEIRTRLDMQLLRLTGWGSSDFLGTTVSGEYAFTRRFSAGLDLPLVYANVSGVAETGIGDIRIKTAFNFIYENEPDGFFEALSGGINLYLNTGDAERGTGIGQSFLAPFLALSYALAEELRFAPVVRQYFTLSKKPADADVKEIHLQIESIAMFSEMIWIKVMPEAVIDFTGYRIPTYNLHSGLGKMFDSNWGLLAEFSTNLAGNPRVDYTSNLTLQYLFE